MSYFRIWAGLQIPNQSGYALTATLTRTAVGKFSEGARVTGSLKLDRFDNGTPTELWKSESEVLILELAGVEAEGEEVSFHHAKLALTFEEGTINVWYAKMTGNSVTTTWEKLESFFDPTYKHGYFGFEGDGITQGTDKFPVHMRDFAAGGAPVGAGGLDMLL